MKNQDAIAILKSVRNLALETQADENGTLVYVKHGYEIPNYQRGYRWGKNEVNALLNDIWEFLCETPTSADTIHSKYCLQPIVLQKNSEAMQNGIINGDTENYKSVSWNVVDGQQRLTTLYLIMHYLFHTEAIYGITYESRPETTKALEEWQQKLDSYNPNTMEFPKLVYSQGSDLDVYYMANAVETIKEWFKAKRKEVNEAKSKFIMFWDRVYVIWYEIPKTSTTTTAIDLFTRINVGKIPLTNAELIKAVLLRRDNNDNSSDCQQQRAMEWDQVENGLSDDEFFYFICNSPEKLETRIDYLFDFYYLTADNKSGAKNSIPDDYGLFDFCFQQIQNQTATTVWRDVKNRYQLLRQWYENRTIYHKIGYLVACTGYDRKASQCQNPSLDLISKLYVKYNEVSSNKEFFKILDEKIANIVKGIIPPNTNFSDLCYGDHSDTIEQLLLLFNVLSMEKAIGGTMRFSFNRFVPKEKSEEWSLEHICPQNPEGCDTVEEQRTWLKACIDELNELLQTGCGSVQMNGIAKTAKGLMETAQKELCKKNAAPFDSTHMAALSIEYQRVGSELISGADVHAISNLALLPRGLNSALGNGLFFKKRIKMREYDMCGRFIPLCTHNVFLKYYSEKDTNLYYWTAQDRKNYYSAILKCLAPYLHKGVIE